MNTTIRITHEDLDLATHLAKRAVIDQKSDLTEREIRLGKLGEIVFVKWLQSQGYLSDYEHEVSKMVLKTESGETVEVRTASEHYPASRILVPVKVYKNNPKDYYVGVRIEHKIAQIKGYACHDEFYLYYNGNYHVYAANYRDLHCIDELLPIF